MLKGTKHIIFFIITINIISIVLIIYTIITIITTMIFNTVTELTCSSVSGSAQSLVWLLFLPLMTSHCPRG